MSGRRRLLPPSLPPRAVWEAGYGRQRAGGGGPFCRGESFGTAGKIKAKEGVETTVRDQVVPASRAADGEPVDSLAGAPHIGHCIIVFLVPCTGRLPRVKSAQPCRLSAVPPSGCPPILLPPMPVSADARGQAPFPRQAGWDGRAPLLAECGVRDARVIRIAGER